MGFRTLAIEQRAGEVWKVLGAVKTEFGKFGDVLQRIQRQLNTASRSLTETGARTRAMARKLREVEELPAVAAAKLLELPAEGHVQLELMDEEDEAAAAEGEPAAEREDDESYGDAPDA